MYGLERGPAEQRGRGDGVHRAVPLKQLHGLQDLYTYDGK